MNSKLFSILWLLTICFNTKANEKDSMSVINSHSFLQIEMSSNWLSTSNPAGLSQMKNCFPSEIKLGYINENGDYKKSHMGSQINHYQLKTRSYKKIKNTIVHGVFSFNKELERNVDYSQVNRADFVAPYTLIDTIGGDTYDREFYALNGALATPISKHFFGGLALNYNVGLAAQDRDPRSQNKVVDLDIRPGFLFQFSNFRVGVNAKYGYYNEDIESIIIENNVQHSFFQTQGLGRYTYHVARSFNRLYQKETFGIAGQLEFNKNIISNLSEFRFEKSLLSVDDGRKGGDGSWSSVKHDARLDQGTFYFQNNTVLRTPFYIHRLAASVFHSKKLGQEFIMRLEQEGETDLEHWKLYGIEDKYSENSTDATLNYSLLGLEENGKMSFLLKGFINYFNISKKYQQPSLNEEWSTMNLGINAQKVIPMYKSAFTVGAKVAFGHNLEHKQNILEDSPVSTKILSPDFLYSTTDYQNYGGNLECELDMNQTFQCIYLKLSGDFYKANNEKNRTVFQLQVGVFF